MEKWEKELRERLQKEISDGAYQIGSGERGLTAWTGKLGRIEFEVALQKEVRKLYGNKKPYRGNLKGEPGYE